MQFTGYGEAVRRYGALYREIPLHGPAREHQKFFFQFLIHIGRLVLSITFCSGFFFTASDMMRSISLMVSGMAASIGKRRVDFRRRHGCDVRQFHVRRTVGSDDDIPAVFDAAERISRDRQGIILKSGELFFFLLAVCHIAGLRHIRRIGFPAVMKSAMSAALTSAESTPDATVSPAPTLTPPRVSAVASGRV